MAIRTSKFLVCIDTEQIEPTQTNQKAQVLYRRARIINVDTLAEVGASQWHDGDEHSEMEIVRYAVKDFYARGGFRSGVRELVNR